MGEEKGVFVWIDCEMTGLDVSREALVEVAVIVTDGQLVPVAEGMDIVINVDESYLAGMNSYVRKMHESSGLLREIAEGVELKDAAQEVFSYVKKHAVGEKKAFLAGNSVAQDRLFLARDMPEVINYLHYRIIDVSTIKELARQWYPQFSQEFLKKTGNHRALGDIQDSIRELELYRKTFFIPALAADLS